MSYKTMNNPWRPPPPPAAAVIAAAAAQDARCAAGEHDEAIAKKGYVTYIRGRQVKSGTRYCYRCKVILPAEASDG